MAKEAISLQVAGYKSAVLSPPVVGRPRYEEWRGIDVFRPAVLRYASTMADKVLYQGAFFSPAWYAAIRAVIEEYEPDVLHVHDVWLGRSALAARRGQRIVMDLHENMPAAAVEYLAGYRGLQRRFNAMFKAYRRVLAYERSLLQRSDLVLGVVEEAVQRIREAHPVLDARRVLNIENLESREFVAYAPARTGSPSNGLTILYIGGVGPHRGLDVLIGAMRHVKDWKLNARLQLVGARAGSTYVSMLRSLITELEVDDVVDMIGWVAADAVLGFIDDAAIGAVPHHSNAHTDSTIPHKLFQYMMASKPVLVSTSAPLARTVRASKGGIVFAAGDPLDCALKIRQLAMDSRLRDELGQAGRRYVLEDGHNWEEESAPRLIAAYDQLFTLAEAQQTMKGTT